MYCFKHPKKLIQKLLDIYEFESNTLVANQKYLDLMKEFGVVGKNTKVLRRLITNDRRYQNKITFRFQNGRGKWVFFTIVDKRDYPKIFSDGDEWNDTEIPAATLP